MTDPLYFIVDWNIHFENNRTRELARMSWVPVPNKHDGDGYRELIHDHPNGTAHYGAWVTIVQVGSKCTPRGVLISGKKVIVADECGNTAGECDATAGECDATASTCRPHNSYSLERKTGVPAEIYNEAIPRLIEIGWLGVTRSLSTLPQASAVIPQASASEWNGMEGNRKREREGIPLGLLQIPEGVKSAFEGLRATGKFAELNVEHVHKVMREFPKANLAEKWKDIALDATSVAGKIDNGMPWLRKAVSRLEVRNLKGNENKESPLASEHRPTFKGYKRTEE